MTYGKYRLQYRLQAEEACRPIEAKKHIKHWEKLLQDIATGIHRYDEQCARNLSVVFVTETAEYRFILVTALNIIANDLYWDERGDWSEATSARVEVL